MKATYLTVGMLLGKVCDSPGITPDELAEHFDFPRHRILELIQQLLGRHVVSIEGMGRLARITACSENAETTRKAAESAGFAVDVHISAK